jgi:hypothetical protein
MMLKYKRPNTVFGSLHPLEDIYFVFSGDTIFGKTLRKDTAAIRINNILLNATEKS